MKDTGLLGGEASKGFNFAGVLVILKPESDILSIKQLCTVVPSVVHCCSVVCR